MLSATYLLCMLKFHFWVAQVESICYHFFLISEFYCKGSFNNYLDKMRWEGGQKLSVFVHVQGIKTVHAVVVCEWPLRLKSYYFVSLDLKLHNRYI